MATASGDLRTRRDVEVRDRGRGWVRDFRETKPFYATSEFLVWVAATAAVIVVTYIDSTRRLTSWHGWLLVTIIAVGYMLSRGIAKSGSRDRSFDHHE